MIKHIIFDLGNVIINVHPDRAMESFAARSQASKRKIQEFYLSELHLDFMRGRYSSQEFCNEMLRRYQLDLDMDDFYSIWNEVIGVPKEGIVPIIEQLGSKFTLSICSNTDQVHWNYCCENFPFLQQFQHYFLSFEMKRDKPDPEVFKEILTTLKAKGGECVFIDDTLVNVEASRQLSIHGIHAVEPKKIRDELNKLNLL